MRFPAILMAGATQGVGWTPRVLGASLLAWWDIEVASSVALAGSNVQTWTDLVGGLAPTQGTDSLRPAYSATGFNGRPVATFDGTDDVLLVSATTGLPTGSTPGEVWVLCDQTALAADTTNRVPFGVGTHNLTGRCPQRFVSGGVNRARGVTGTGAGNTLSTAPAVDFSGRHVLRIITTATDTAAEVNGTAGAAASAVPATATSRTSIGANAATSGSAFWQGGINSILVTGLLSADQAAALYAYLGARR